MANPLPRGKTGVLIVSPTRELASQIAEEAKVLATFHKLTVQVRRWSPWMAIISLTFKWGSSACHHPV